MRIRDPGGKKIGSGMEKIRIRDKHPGSAKLLHIHLEDGPHIAGTRLQGKVETVD
jgi:hypothetical protein